MVFPAHVDTIGVARERERWPVDAFARERREGRLYGRGAADMNGGTVAVAALNPCLAGWPPQGRQLLAVSAAENANCRRAPLILAPGKRAFATQSGARWLHASARGGYGHDAFSKDRTGDRGDAIGRLARYLDCARVPRLAEPAHCLVGASSVDVGTIRGGPATLRARPRGPADIGLRLVPGRRHEPVAAAWRAIAGPQVMLESLDSASRPDRPRRSSVRGAAVCRGLPRAGHGRTGAGRRCRSLGRRRDSARSGVIDGERRTGRGGHEGRHLRLPHARQAGCVDADRRARGPRIAAMNARLPPTRGAAPRRACRPFPDGAIQP
ncbi:hypothetical protein Y5A_008440 [Burkholderia glumae AU6208]|nr:hypothetical protein Y5A_008440 [Burkholderia glumae AU6208]